MATDNKQPGVGQADPHNEVSSVVGLGFCGPGAGSNTAIVDVKDGKLLRLRPLPLNWQYEGAEKDEWTMEARGKTFQAKYKALIPPFSLGYKKRVYSANRVKYPLKRVDFDVNGAPDSTGPGGRNTQNRGKSKFKRIRWEEALDIVEAEIKRVQETYGPTAVLPQWGGHGEVKVVHNPHGFPNALLDLLGGYTFEVRNPDSWEGWHWGAMHVWGMPPVGQPPSANCMLDISRYSDMLLFWGCDPETTPWGVDGLAPTRMCYWFKELGIDCVYICPDLNYGAAVHADKWIPVRPGTDAALYLAIAYMWITEGTWDKEYVATHAFGYDKFEEYVLGKEDGIPKTPAWAVEKCGVPEWTIKALARQWAKKPTSTVHGNGGPGIRSAYSTENGRLEALLLTMQSLGGKGKHYVKMIEWWQFCDQNPMCFGEKPGMVIMASASMPKVRRFNMDGTGAKPMVPKMAPPASDPGKPPTPPMEAGKPQTVSLASAREAGLEGPGNDAGGPPPIKLRLESIIPKNLVHDALTEESISWYGTARVGAPIEDQFQKYTFPAEGGSRIHMIWTDSPCYSTCWNDSNAYQRALVKPEIEFIVAQHPWLESDCYFADVILPVATKFELEDIDNDTQNGQYNIVSYQKQAIQPVGESLSDFEVVGEVAKRFNLYKEFTNDRTVGEMIEDGFYGSGCDEYVSFEDWKKKGYAIIPAHPDWDKVPPGLRAFHDDPDNNRLLTPSGKIEFFSQNLAKYFPDDEERPPVPHWIESGVSHDERISSVRAETYPLLVVSNHPHWRMHANCDDITWCREAKTAKVRGFDGYQYEPLWLNPADAEARGIADGDIVRIFNERGALLAGAYVAERIMEGSISMDHGARYDPIIPGEFDRGGAINTITPHNKTSKNATGMVCSSFLVEVEKVTPEMMDEWKKDYPEAFARTIDPAQGVCLAGWLEGEEL